MNRVSMQVVRRVLVGASMLGVDERRLAADLRLEPAALDDPDARLPEDRMNLLWEEAERRTGEPAYGIRMIELARDFPPDFVLGYAVLSSATLRDAFRRIMRYVRLMHDGLEVSLCEDDDPARLRYRIHAQPPPSRHSIEYGVGLLWEAGRRGVGPDFRVREARFRHPRAAPLDLYERLFCAPVRFEQGETELLLDRALLDSPMRGADPALVAILERHIQSLLKVVPQPGDFAGRVRQAIDDGLRDGTPTSEEVSRCLGCSVRTLHRRLTEEGLTFQGLLNGIRRERAMHLLGEGQMEIGAIAFLLGFSEVSAFYRAFRRWAGCTPAEYRHRGSPGNPGASAT